MSQIPDAIREQVRARAGDRCEYCGKPAGFTLYSHHVDHIISLKHDGSSEPDNLAWACFQCNVSKGSDVAGYDAVTGDLVPLFNPRSQEWSEHFSFDGPTIIGKTAIGRITVRLLQMNDPEEIQVRQRLMNAGQW